MKLLKNYYLKYYKEIILAIIFLVAEALCELQIPGYIADIISKGIALNDQAVIKECGLMMMLYTGICVVCSVFVTYFASKVGSFVARDLREDLYKKIITFTHQEYEQFEMASLITRCTNDITQVENFTISFLRLAMLVPVMSVGGIIKAIEYSSSIQSIENIIVIGISIIVFIMIAGLVIVLPKVKLMQKQMDKINRVSSDALLGMMDIRALNNEQLEINRFGNANKELKKTSTFVNRIMQVLVPAMTTIMYVLSILVLIVIAKVVEDVSQIANMMAFIQYVMHVIVSFTIVAMVFFVLPRAIVAFRRIKEILNVENKEEESLTNKIENGSIVFKNVSLKFNNDENYALEDISFEIENGEKVAIVGATGSGKSSIIRLITKLVKKSDGNIKIGNVDIEGIKSKDLRQDLSCVMQKSFLFSGTIKSNVAYSNNLLEEIKIKRALDISSASEFVEKLENKLDSDVKQNGANLSGGQKQRLNIARSVAKEALIYIFDDSFSALDFNTDLNIRQHINKYLKDKTVIMVAQRISTIKNADKIIVLDKGKIVNIGKHEELIENCEIYKQIAKSQLVESDE